MFPVLSGQRGENGGQPFRQFFDPVDDGIPVFPENSGDVPVGVRIEGGADHRVGA